MEIRVLGPVELHGVGGRVELGPRKQRFLLAILALEVNRLVPTDRLIELTWPDGAPRTAQHAVQVSVSRLRTVLAEAGSEATIETRGAGYLLRAEPSVVDAARFWALLDAAAAASTDTGRVELLTQALGLWSGPALSGAAPPSTREQLCFALEEARLNAAEDRLDAQLRLGRHRAVLAELGEFVQAHPTRERPLAQLMLAMHRSGQTGPALELYRQTRVRLADQFGLDPGPALRELEVAMLRADPALDLPSGVAVASESTVEGRRPAVRTPVPRQLPPEAAGFTGRQQELAALDGLTGAIVIVGGTGGVGKTTLAVHWAHRVADRFPDGQLYVNLRGFDPGGTALDPSEAVRGFLDAFGVRPDAVPAGLAAQAALYRSLLAGSRVLVLLDNARDVDQVRPLLPGTPGCLTLVTSRSQLTPLVASEGAQALPLNLLTATESRDLLAERLGADRIAAEPDAVDEIVVRCARLPLALAIAAARAAVNPGFPLAALASELAVAAGGLDVLQGGDALTDLRAVFSWSYRTLGPEAARLFRLLGLHPGPDIAVPAVVSLAGVAPSRARLLLTELTRAHLLTEHRPGRYTFHDLLRVYATEQAGLFEPVHDVVHRIVDHYLHSACAAAFRLYPQRDPIDLKPALSDVDPEEPANHDAALRWFTDEHQVLLAVMELAAGNGFDVHVWQLAWAVTTYLLRQGHWRDQIAVQRNAFAAAGRLGDRFGQAHALRSIARAQVRLADYTEADDLFRQALELSTVDDHLGRAHTYLGWHDLAERQGRAADALRYAQEALALYRRVDNKVGIANSLNSIGWGFTRLGRHAEALDFCTEALALMNEIGHRNGAAATWDSLGHAHRGLGDFAQATACYRAAIALYLEIGDQYIGAESMVSLGDTYAAAGDPAAAREAWREALAILDDLGHADAEAVRRRLGLPGRNA